MTHEQVADRIEGFIREQFAVAADDPRFHRRASLFASGYVDSIGVAELLVFLEEAVGTTVPDDALLSEDFDSIDGIARIVMALRGPGTASAANGRPEPTILDRLPQKGARP